MLPVPGAVAAGIAPSTETTFPLGEGRGRPRTREVQSDCQDRLVGGQDNPSRRRADHKQGRVSHGERKPIHDAIRDVTSVRAHEVPPGSGLPKRDQHRSCPLLLSKRPPTIPYQTKRAVNPTILSKPKLFKGIDAGRAPALVQGKEPSTRVIRVRREEVHRVGTPSVIQ
jgi:hypothetical protein